MIVVFSVPVAIAGGFLVAALTTDTSTFYEVYTHPPHSVLSSDVTPA